MLYQDDALWDLATDSRLVETKRKYQDYAAQGLLQSVGPGFSLGALYDAQDQQRVGVPSLFFGFRTLAANFLWMQVEKFWHEGQMHRMLPLMQTSVALDPNFVDAYLIGAWHRAYNMTAKLSETPLELKVFDERRGVIGQRPPLECERHDRLRRRGRFGLLGGGGEGGQQGQREAAGGQGQR